MSGFAAIIKYSIVLISNLILVLTWFVYVSGNSSDDGHDDNNNTSVNYDNRNDD